MKNDRLLMLGIVRGILTDITSNLPFLIKEAETCFQVLSSAIEHRGLPLFTITLPEASKYLESSIQDGRLGVNRPQYHKRYRNDDPRPCFMHGLWCMIFDDQGCVLEHPDAYAVSALRQIYLFAKKWKADCERNFVVSAVAEYYEVERALPRPRPETWDSDVPSWSRLFGHPLWGNQTDSSDARQHHLFGLEQPKTSIKYHHWKLFRELCSRLSSSLGYLDVWAIRPKHGPGVVSDQLRGVVKYDFANWPKKLDAIFPHDFFASHDFVSRIKSDKEYPCKLIAVPKTQKGPRLIASEPTAHQWIQGGLQRWFEDAIAHTPLGLSINFRDQAGSQELALEASKTGSFATVDLSAASDRLSARLVDYVFQANTSLLDALHACRSRSVVVPKDLSPSGADEVLMLRKFAAMGSAVTFPIQTIIFTIIGHMALLLADGSRDCSLPALRARAHRLRVFGDDIIIDTKAYEYLVELLTELGLKVNESKSFHKGYFREACGMDAFNGIDVTPAYFRTYHEPSNPESLASVIECANNFYRKGWWHTSDAVLKTVDDKITSELAVLSGELSSMSLFTYIRGSYIPTRRRWNKTLQRDEYLTLQLVQQTKKNQGSGEASLFQYFTEDPSTYTLWDSDEPLSTWSAGQAKKPTIKIKRRWKVSSSI